MFNKETLWLLSTTWSNAMHKKYFFFDIDGTLAYGKPGQRIPPESAKYTVRKLQENGHFVAVATGRSYPTSIEFLNELGLHNMVCDGGNGIVIDDELLEVKPLDKEKCVRLINECREKKIPWAFSYRIEKTRYSDSEKFKEATGFYDMDVRVIEDLDPNDYEEIYKVYVAGEESELETLKELPHCRYHDSYFFVEPTQKEKGIYRMMEYLKAPLEDVVVFGDGLNDLSMFKDEWTSIAMGDGAEELKEKADYVTDSAKNDGIYKACIKFGWIEE